MNEMMQGTVAERYRLVVRRFDFLWNKSVPGSEAEASTLLTEILQLELALSMSLKPAPSGIGMTLVEPGGARTEFRYGSARVATLTSTYSGTPANAFERMLDPKNGLAAGDPKRMATRIIESVDTQPAPMRLLLGSQALDSTIQGLRKRIDEFEAQRDIAASTDFPPGE